MYCSFCGRVVQNEFQFCPFCGVQCRDLPAAADGIDCLSAEGDAVCNESAMHRLEVMVSALSVMESELDHFLASKKS